MARGTENRQTQYFVSAGFLYHKMLFTCRKCRNAGEKFIDFEQMQQRHRRAAFHRAGTAVSGAGAAQGLEWGRRGNAAAGTLPAQCGKEGSGAAAWGDNAGEGVRRGGYYWASALLPPADGAGSAALRFSSARWACICS